MSKKILKGETADFDAIMVSEKEFEKLIKDKQILDKIETIVRDQNGLFISNNT